ncbi:hypothetical protein AHF37_09516 [Paragonimus kellicotti]|nr:hypothetical protein AHF37_09516 [Paragonimus kellicotti]
MASLEASFAEVCAFLRKRKVSESVISKFEMHAIDGLSFCLLTEQDLREMHISSVSQRKRLIFLAASWRRAVERSFHNQLSPLSDLFNDINCDRLTAKCTYPTTSDGLLSSLLDCSEYNCNVASGDSADLVCTRESSDYDKLPYDPVEPHPHMWKVFVSALYAFIVAGITAFVMVIAHERLPDMSKYPPLPDLLLDNLPHITWAFKAAEWVGVLLMFMWIIILFFHRYRQILLRRFFALTGTVFLLRSITMLITSLSVPGRHLTEHCTPYEFANQTARFNRVLEIWLGFGMSIRGIHTCGDYMFSGHTTCLTLLNFFITEYSPSRIQLLHTFSWVLNLFGVFFIMASHEHYSIDVFVAVYVTSRLFLYYHCLANNRILHQADKKRALIWFPLFSFFEYDVDGIVPNVYELPFRTWRNWLFNSPKTNHINSKLLLATPTGRDGCTNCTDSDEISSVCRRHIPTNT